MISKNIFNDIEKLKFKNLDIYSIEENNIDLTFFDLNEDDEDDKLKLLKQTYVTANYKEETILNLQKTLEEDSRDMSKELKLESYKKYNNALELANRKYITNAIELIEQAVSINPKDVEILNLRGLLSLLACKFPVAIESFYISMCYKKEELQSEYVDKLTSEDFRIFLARYNHAIRFINEELNEESISILNNIIDEEPELIEPYVILALLYDKMRQEDKKEEYLKVLRIIDRGHDLIEIKEVNKEDKEEEKKSNKLLGYVVLGGAILMLGGYALANKNQVDDLNTELAQKEEQLSQAEEEAQKIKEEADKKAEEEAQKAKEEAEKKAKEEAEKKAKEEADKKAKEEAERLEGLSEVKLFENGVTQKQVGNYEASIKSFKDAAAKGDSEKYQSQALYQVAMLSEKIGNEEDAIEYYNKYIVAYPNFDDYYDDALYSLGMIYYENEDLDNAKKIFRILKNDESDSMYYNSKIKDILAQ